MGGLQIELSWVGWGIELKVHHWHVAVMYFHGCYES
jgi:hypothetical protein